MTVTPAPTTIGAAISAFAATTEKSFDQFGGVPLSDKTSPAR